MGFKVWVNPITGEPSERLPRLESLRNWSVARGATEGDLILWYRTLPHAHIADIFRVAGRVQYLWGGDFNQRAKDWFAPMRRVCKLKTPLHLKELKAHPILKDAGFVRSRMQGRTEATAHWPEIREAILMRNPGLKKALARYGPERAY